jgi:hypothetical protein
MHRLADGAVGVDGSPTASCARVELVKTLNEGSRP